jgi:hypothetical protein
MVFEHRFAFFEDHHFKASTANCTNPVFIA